MDTYLSPHFSLQEMIQSQTASREGIDNTPPADVIPHLATLCCALEHIRSFFNSAILVSSGYRNPVVNKLVGGVPDSDHVLGYAADILCPGIGSPAEVCFKLVQSRVVAYDQIIHEYGAWCHISVNPRMRGQALTIFKGWGKFRPGILKPDGTPYREGK
jgi:zinc D-Ala-D-Ala carboxypeptidase